ncbi:hypothetical protein DB30_06385 [Enhygromyxa salina]|uniref:AMIN domain-containing protein n=1 Tax=Enhygromyxa salina TaxID=215803 RepID=A0A0C1ZAW9_9BACT|nr:hypothetical protein DB30_06385 [Enhygromyxa salina]
MTSGTAALLLVAGSAWAGPPPPPPTSGDPEIGRTNAAPPPPTSSRIETTPADPLVIDQRTPDTDLKTNWSYSRGSSRAPNYIGSVDEDPFYSVNPIGYYQGVSLGGGNLPPFAPTEVGGASAVLTWTGFERTEASSRVFFQLSASVQPDVTAEGTRVTIKLPRTSVKIRNNRRKLITKFFNTPVNEVKVERTGKDVRIVLDLRWEATPDWRFEAGPNGYTVLVVEFADSPNQTPSVPPPPAGGDVEQGSDGSGPFLPSGAK